MKVMMQLSLHVGKIWVLIASFIVVIDCYAVQLCQGETIRSTSPTERFIVHENGTVADSQNGLMWQQCIAGLSTDNSDKRCEAGAAKTFTWEQALNYRQWINANTGLAGYHDWRLPNVRELNTLVELQCENPAINLNVFPNTPGTKLWTSSPYHFYTHYSWYVDFLDGTYSYGERIDSSLNVRLVRYLSTE